MGNELGKVSAIIFTGGCRRRRRYQTFRNVTRSRRNGNGGGRYSWPRCAGRARRHGQVIASNARGEYGLLVVVDLDASLAVGADGDAAGAFVDDVAILSSRQTSIVTMCFISKIIH